MNGAPGGWPSFTTGCAAPAAGAFGIGNGGAGGMAPPAGGAGGAGGAPLLVVYTKPFTTPVPTLVSAIFVLDLGNNPSTTPLIWSRTSSEANPDMKPNAMPLATEF